jgi:hypothetical protein
MFETAYVMKVNPKAIDWTVPARFNNGELAESEVQYPLVQPRYSDCWRTLPKVFDGSLKPTFPAPSAAPK